MPLTFDQVAFRLSAIEPNEGMYAGIGPAEIPVLRQLLQDQEPWKAARAVYALSRIDDAEVVPIIRDAASDPRSQVRVAVAASAKHLKPEWANALLTTLLDDADMGVRKFAVQSVSSVHAPAVHEKLRQLRLHDSVPALRALTDHHLRSVLNE